MGQPLLVTLGSLGAAFGAVVNFCLGSNKGSDRTKELRAGGADQAVTAEHGGDAVV